MGLPGSRFACIFDDIMNIDGPKNAPAIPPVEPVPDTGKPGDQRKSLEERVLDAQTHPKEGGARSFGDRVSLSTASPSEDDINLNGISREDAAALAGHAAFRAWEHGAREIPPGLLQLRNALTRVAAAEAPEAQDATFLRGAGSIIKGTGAEAARPGGFNPSDIYALAQLEQDARKIAATLSLQQAQRGK